MYQDPIIQKYIDLIKAGNRQLKVFYQGEPTRIGASVLPCCVISKRQTRVRHFTNAQDEHEVGISIRIIVDIRSELSTSENDEKVIAGIAKLYDMVEGRNADLTLKDTSILDILRTNELVDATYNLRTDLASITIVDYGETLASRNPVEWLIEARVDLVAHFVQTR